MMHRLTYDPPLPRASHDGSCLQRIELRDGKRLIGQAAWFAPATDIGVVQLIELSVAEDSRRHGHATTLLNDVIAQARALCRQRKLPLRRLWLAVEQRSQVLARAFLTKHGFHHTATIGQLMKKQDLLVYVKSFD